MNTDKTRMALVGVLIVAACVFFTGIQWGLPTRAGDEFLLGADGHARRLEALTDQVPEVDASRGADVVGDSVAGGKSGDTDVVVNATEAQKAQILCRYRLYSFQPDEMITFRALSVMKPRAGDFDPRLYQYGGLWIYGVGALIEAASKVGLVQIASRATYIANPEMFGRFYVVARAYSAAWGVAGAWAVFALIRRLGCGGWFAPAVGTLCFVCMPVAITTAHEAKPHLGGAVLILMAVLAGDDFVRTGKAKWAVITGIFCGAAAGMVLWGVVSFVLFVVLAVITKKPRLVGVATMVALAIYGVSNPYVVYHLARDPGVLLSNLGNTSAMYHVGGGGLPVLNGIRLSAAGTGPLLFVAGVVASIRLVWRRSSAGILLGAVAMAAAIPYLILSSEKIGEYGRFALLPDMALLIAAIVGCGRWGRPGWRVGILAATCLYGGFYLAGFVRDCGPWRQTSRGSAALELQRQLSDQQSSLALYADPAPYCLPPVDLDQWEIWRLPAGGIPVQGVLIRPVDALDILDPRQTPLSWADKRFEIQATDARSP